MSRINIHFTTLVVCLFALITTSSAQNVVAVSWTDLAKVTFENRYLPDDDLNHWFPLFSDAVKALDGKEITISGHIIPVDVDADYYVLSSNPFASCFFCGGAGPETVMELNFKKNHGRFKTDEYLTFTGRLRLNPDNIYELTYVLEEADVVK